MKKLLVVLGLLIVVGIKSYSQTTINGVLKTKKGESVMFANIAIKGSFD